ncbi:MAG: hypothetical protein KF847_16330 [Pirellulales bacterium]|nr:hypothetical protein [Pirellulales bacterium]
MAIDRASAAPRGLPPLTAAVRQRLQKVFDHAQRSLDKQDFDYAIQLLGQCVAEDPGNLIYLQTFLATLEKKLGGVKRPSTIASLKVKSHRSALVKAAEKGDWDAAFQAGCAALAVSPWDATTLMALADACQELGCHEPQLYCLRWALKAAPKDAVLNRAAALALQRMGQFDQAIACWHRVEQVKPHDEEAQNAISRLSVEKTIHDGGYDPELLGSGRKEPLAHLPAKVTGEGAEGTEAPSEQSAEERIEAAIAANPGDATPYLQLADFYAHRRDLDGVERALDRANQATGGGNLAVRDRIEDLHIAQAYRQVQIAEQHHAHEKTPESEAVLSQARTHASQVELEVFTARADRDPQNPRLKFELGMRLRRVGKWKEAITALQAARGDVKRKALVLLELGECFQKIEQYKLALSNYEGAIEAAAENPEADVHKLALYRAGVLATGLRELDLAERRLTTLAGLDFGYRDVAERLDKINKLRDSG